MSPLHAILEESLATARLPLGTPVGTLCFRVAGDEDLWVTLAKDRCTVERRETSTERADLTIYTTPAEALSFLESRSLEPKPLRVSGRHELLLALARVVAPPQSLLETRLSQ